jgi:hypothetical protein
MEVLMEIREDMSEGEDEWVADEEEAGTEHDRHAMPGAFPQ